MSSFTLINLNDKQFFTQLCHNSKLNSDKLVTVVCNSNLRVRFPHSYLKSFFKLITDLGLKIIAQLLYLGINKFLKLSVCMHLRKVKK